MKNMLTDSLGFGLFMAIIAVVALVVVGCADGLPTKTERCMGYRITLDSAKALTPGADRDNRIAVYNALVEECKRAGL